MGSQTVLSTLQVTRDVLLAPMTVFERTRDSNLTKEVIIIFGIGVLITFTKALSKSFGEPQQSVNFFANEYLNEVLSVLSYPLVTLLFFYLLYGAFLLGVFGISRIFKKDARAKPLVSSLMAVSAIGVVTQLVFLFFTFSLPKQALFIGEYVVYCWVLVISVLAIKESQGLSTWSAIVCFLIPFLILLLVGVQLSVAPYLF